MSESAFQGANTDFNKENYTCPTDSLINLMQEMQFSYLKKIM